MTTLEMSSTLDSLTMLNLIRKDFYDMLHPGDMVLVNVKHPEVFMNPWSILKVADYYDVEETRFLSGIHWVIVIQ